MATEWYSTDNPLIFFDDTSVGRVLLSANICMSMSVRSTSRTERART